MKLKIKLENYALEPLRAHSTDAGLDLRSPVDVWIHPGEHLKIDTGVRMAIPDGYVGLITSKSGLMLHGITSRGTLDSMYRGTIGAVLYLVVVRCWMMKAQADGKKCYVNRWPEWFDLEERIYRPLLMKILPGILGFLCKILDNALDVIRAAGAIVAGILDILVDVVVVLLRNTVYRDSRERTEPEEGNAFTHALGVFLSSVKQILDKITWKDGEEEKELEHKLVLKYTAFKESAMVIGRTLSFGLVLFCIGLCATLIYLLVVAFR